MTTITPTLFLGARDASPNWADLIPVDTAGDAYTVIRSGHSALLPPGAWEEAAGTLRLLGGNEELVALRLKQAGYTSKVTSIS